MGRFIGDVKTQWLVVEEPKKLPWYKRATSLFFDWDADREMLLLEDFHYEDDNGFIWTARTGDVVDGASIPRVFWKVIGSPLIGKYRRSSVIHDVLCQRKEIPSKKVHELFCEMMKIDGVAPIKKKLMCFAVKKFGPRF
jgi:hypothetical protein